MSLDGCREKSGKSGVEFTSGVNVGVEEAADLPACVAGIQTSALSLSVKITVTYAEGCLRKLAAATVGKNIGTERTPVLG
jgi:hypothetical protein